MSLFCNIIQKIIDDEKYIEVQSHTCNEYWEYIYNKCKEECSTQKQKQKQNFFFYLYISNLFYHSDKKGNFIYNKYFYLNSFLSNLFTNDNDKAFILNIFQKSQRVYNGFARLAHIYKYKKATIKINMDLYMNELQEGEKNVFTVLQDRSKYLFTMDDLIKMVNSSLTNAPFFFSDPLQPKNPFNNVPFNISILYNIYFFVKDNCHKNMVLFELFFRANFDLNRFLYDNECYIRDLAIKNYTNNSPPNVLYNSLQNMFEVNRMYTKKIFIHSDIPKDTIVDIFRPYFYLYFTFKYGVNGTEKRIKSYYLLKKKLKDFVVFNPLFGRKKYTIKKQFVNVRCNVTNKTKVVLKEKAELSFNLKHIHFYNGNVDSFSKSNIFNEIEGEEQDVSEQDVSEQDVSEESEEEGQD